MLQIHGGYKQQNKDSYITIPGIIAVDSLKQREGEIQRLPVIDQHRDGEQCSCNELAADPDPAREKECKCSDHCKASAIEANESSVACAADPILADRIQNIASEDVLHMRAQVEAGSSSLLHNGNSGQENCCADENS